MKYICTDRGSRRCPCVLMETGQCYTCTMIREGVCSCEEAAGWQGVCPYTEYLQLGGYPAAETAECPSPLNVLSETAYGGGLHVIRLAVSPGFSEQCRRPGSYLMAEAMGWRTPLSVLRTGPEWVEVLVKEAGPKSRKLMQTADDAGSWNVAGPYFNGLLHSDGLERWLAEDGGTLFAAARGTAAAPLISMLETLQQKKKKVILYLDDEVLPESFLEEYLTGLVYERVCFGLEENLQAVKRLVKRSLSENCCADRAQVMVLVSPYYSEKLTADMRPEERNQVILPNHANLCCGEGICGSCSHTDRDGVTVRLCKCSGSVVE